MIKRQLVLKGIILVMLGSMMGSCTLTKRKHRKGFHIERARKYSAKKSEEKYAFVEHKKDLQLAKSKVIVPGKENEAVLIANNKATKLVLAKPVSVMKKELKLKSKALEEKQSKNVKHGESLTNVEKAKILSPPKEAKVNKYGEVLDDLGEREIWAYMGLLFTLVTVILPAGLGILAIIYNIKGLKSKKKNMAIWCLSITVLLLGLAVLSYFAGGYFYFFGIVFAI